jgi:hypothetical protein
MKIKRKTAIQFLNDDSGDDPMSSLANLFDVSMVFAVALMVAMVSFMKMSEMLTQDDVTIVKNPGKQNMEIIRKQGEKIEKYKTSEIKSTGDSKGKRIGTAYELENGEIIYIPE